VVISSLGLPDSKCLWFRRAYFHAVFCGGLYLFSFIILGYNRDRQWLTVLTLLLVLLVYQSRFTIRPDIFSLLFFVLNIYILSLHINKRWPSMPW